MQQGSKITRQQDAWRDADEETRACMCILQGPFERWMPGQKVILDCPSALAPWAYCALAFVYRDIPFNTDPSPGTSSLPPFPLSPLLPLVPPPSAVIIVRLDWMLLDHVCLPQDLPR